MTITVFHPVLTSSRPLAPPLRPGGGGFYYIKRRSDGALLCGGDDYVEFETVEAALEYIFRELKHFADDQFEVRYMPKLVTN